MSSGLRTALACNHRLLFRVEPLFSKSVRDRGSAPSCNPCASASATLPRRRRRPPFKLRGWPTEDPGRIVAPVTACCRRGLPPSAQTPEVAHGMTGRCSGQANGSFKGPTGTAHGRSASCATLVLPGPARRPLRVDQFYPARSRRSRVTHALASLPLAVEARWGLGRPATTRSSVLHGTASVRPAG